MVTEERVNELKVAHLDMVIDESLNELKKVFPQLKDGPYKESFKDYFKQHINDLLEMI